MYWPKKFRELFSARNAPGCPEKNGFFFGLTLILIFTARFLIEFIKERQVAFEESMKLDMGQLLSFPYIIIGIGFIIYGIQKTKKLTILSSNLV